ncbi:MAG: hypothetical protein KJ607_12850, partial [Bacteroidetes bacterium]|nr:hypothetical protein [Bacteroidota bacterium]
MKKLESVGMVCEYLPEISYEEAKRIIHRYYGLVIRSRFNVDRQFIDCAGNLRFIARAGSGLENIDVLHAKDRGIACFNSPEGNRDAVGEHALGLLLAVVNKICSADREVRDGKWNRKSNWGTELKGKTIGIIGYGNTGSALAEKLSGLGTKVISYDKYKTGYSDAFTEETGMDRIFEETEILSFHVPLTDETVNLVDCNYIDRFKKPFIIINTSRGGIIKTEDLTDALQDGRITGAGLDVLEYEGADFEALNFYELQQSF